jgi:plastocyanin
MRALISILVLTAAVAGAPAHPRGPRLAGSVRGRVTFADPLAPSAPRPAVGDLGGHSREQSLDRRAVVYLESAPRLAFDELPASRARMDQRNEQFSPRVLAVTVGTTVDFPNNDTKFHNVFSLSSRVKAFDLGRYPPGHSGSVRFDKPGIVRVFCDIHSQMSGYILVFSHPFFSVTDLDGRYTIAGVPAGTYTLVVWSEVGSAALQRVVIADGGVAEADFQVGRGR